VQIKKDRPTSLYLAVIFASLPEDPPPNKHPKTKNPHHLHSALLRLSLIFVFFSSSIKDMITNTDAEETKIKTAKPENNKNRIKFWISINSWSLFDAQMGFSFTFVFTADGWMYK
jgi:hypothetical protein